MGRKLTFHVMSGADSLGNTRTPQLATEVLRHHGDFGEFIAQFVDLAWGDTGHKPPIVPSQPILRGFKLDLGTGVHPDTRAVSEDVLGTLRFVYAGDTVRASLPTSAGHFDRAVMAYLATLHPDTPIVLYVR